ncbi:hypothetical protein AB0B07_25110 [Streptomyces sioyaensis]|uniref:hypothetical protein n=1 Tax=Streptomyces sioyaensis TaxID=67364 RepID=UPI0033C59242
MTVLRPPHNSGSKAKAQNFALPLADCADYDHDQSDHAVDNGADADERESSAHV